MFSEVTIGGQKLLLPLPTGKSNISQYQEFISMIEEHKTTNSEFVFVDYSTNLVHTNTTHDFKEEMMNLFNKLREKSINGDFDGYRIK